MFASEDLGLFGVDPTGPLPVHEQLKDQIKLAYGLRLLRPGQVLPSIRVLAAQAGVGDALVRRAYRELTATGLLVTRGRKAVALNPNLTMPEEAERLVTQSFQEAERLLKWTDDNGLNPISFARLVSRRALAEQLGAPTCVMVDACTEAADHSARRVGKAWDIKVAPLSLVGFMELTAEQRQRFTTVLADADLHEQVIQLNGDGRGRVFAVRSRIAPSFIRRARRLPRKASILIVVSEEYFRRAAQVALRRCQEIAGRDYRFEIQPMSEIPDLAALAVTRQYQLIVPHLTIWPHVPPRVRRLPRVFLSFTELDVQALEEIRIAAGIVV